MYSKISEKWQNAIIFKKNLAKSLVIQKLFVPLLA